jgi:hypothetical protein
MASRGFPKRTLEAAFVNPSAVVPTFRRITRTTDMKKTDKVGRGQTIRADYPKDSSSHKLPNTTGGSFGGGDEYLGHSLNGASVDPQGTGHGKKDRFS